MKYFVDFDIDFGYNFVDFDIDYLFVGFYTIDFDFDSYLYSNLINFIVVMSWFVWHSW